MIGFCPLASGSKGNSIYLGTKEAKILIDAGVGPRILAERLGQLGVDLGQIDAILITHEHTDHIKGLESLALKRGIPVFANSDTAKGIYAALHVCPKFKIFSTGEKFQFADLAILPFSVQHDTLDPVGFAIQVGNLKLGFCTDLGFVTPLVEKQLEGCDYLLIEANHEPAMVHASARPLIYKQRVLGRQGHLSNEQCADLLSKVQHSGLKHVHLAHLSSECNAPKRALEVVRQKLLCGIELSIAPQDALGKAILFS